MESLRVQGRSVFSRDPGSNAPRDPRNSDFLRAGDFVFFFMFTAGIRYGYVFRNKLSIRYPLKNCPRDKHPIYGKRTVSIRRSRETNSRCVENSTPVPALAVSIARKYFTPTRRFRTICIIIVAERRFPIQYQLLRITFFNVGTLFVKTVATRATLYV